MTKKWYRYRYCFLLYPFGSPNPARPGDAPPIGGTQDNMGESAAMTRTADAGENIPFEGLRQSQTTGDDPLKLILGSEPVFELVMSIVRFHIHPFFITQCVTCVIHITPSL